jgi:Flp pilus assembly protein TadD
VATKDTASAIAALDLAVQINPNNPLSRAIYGDLLGRVGRFDEAEAHLRAAMAAEPFYAEPYALLGDVYAAAKRIDDAVAQFREYLLRSAKSDPRRRTVEQHLRLLTESRT